MGMGQRRRNNRWDIAMAQLEHLTSSRLIAGARRRCWRIVAKLRRFERTAAVQRRAFYKRAYRALDLA